MSVALETEISMLENKGYIYDTPEWDADPDSVGFVETPEVYDNNYFDAQSSKVRIDFRSNKAWKLIAYLGPCILMSTAMLDPANVGVDLQAGSSFQYRIIWAVVLSTAVGFLYQLLALKLGLASRFDLARSLSLVMEPRMRYVIWIFSEVSIIFAELAEVVGMSIAFNLLFGIPIHIGAPLTFVNTILILYIDSFGMLFVEAAVTVFILIMCMSFLVSVCYAAPDASMVFMGFVPNYYNVAAALGAVSLLGAVVMPHNLFLHSTLVKSRHYEKTKCGIADAIFYSAIGSAIALGFSAFISVVIIVLAGSKLYPSEIALAKAYVVMQELLGERTGLILYGIALLCCGQASTISCTYAGQFILEGFLKIRLKLWQRALISRCFSILPASLLLFFFPNYADDLIFISSIFLALLLPFIIVPLIKLTSSPRVVGPDFINSPSLNLLARIINWVIIFANIVISGSTIWDMVEKSVVWVKALSMSITGILLIVYIGIVIWLDRIQLNITRLCMSRARD